MLYIQAEISERANMIKYCDLKTKYNILTKVYKCELRKRSKQQMQLTLKYSSTFTLLPHDLM